MPEIGAKLLGALAVATRIGIHPDKRIRDEAAFAPVVGKTAEAIRKQSTGTAFLQHKEERKKEIDDALIERRKASLPNIVALEGNRAPRRGHVAAKDSVDITKKKHSTDKGKGRQKSPGPSRD